MGVGYPLVSLAKQREPIPVDILNWSQLTDKLIKYCLDEVDICQNHIYFSVFMHVCCVMISISITVKMRQLISLTCLQKIYPSSRSYRLVLCTTLSSVHYVTCLKYTSCFARSVKTISTRITLSQAKLPQRVTTTIYK